MCSFCCRPFRSRALASFLEGGGHFRNGSASCLDWVELTCTGLEAYQMGDARVPTWLL